MNEIKNKWRGRMFRYAPLILWLAVIFVTSSSTGSMSSTSRIIRPLLEWLFPDTPENTLLVYHGYIRKFAHFAEYAALGFFAARAFWSSTAPIARQFWFVYAFLIVLLTAGLDEYNQSFNALRTSSVYDVLIDCAGGLTMIVLCFIYRKVERAQ
jgi:VanZ family protein